MQTLREALKLSYAAIEVKEETTFVLAASSGTPPMKEPLRLPSMSGVEATRQIVSSSPRIRVLVVTMFEDDHLVFAAMRAGARLSPKGGQA